MDFEFTEACDMEDEFGEAFVGKKITKVTAQVFSDSRIFGAVHSLTFWMSDGSQHTMTAVPTGTGDAAIDIDYVETKK